MLSRLWILSAVRVSARLAVGRDRLDLRMWDGDNESLSSHRRSGYRAGACWDAARVQSVSQLEPKRLQVNP